MAGGHPAPVVTWQRSVFGFIDRLPNNSLIVKSATLEDSGPYSCVAENGLGIIYTKFNIIVKGM